MIDEAEARRTAEPEAATAGHEAAAPRVAMLFSATSWTFNVRLGRSGREEGEGVILIGEVSYRSQAGDRRVHPARAMIVRSDSRKRLEFLLSPQERSRSSPSPCSGCRTG